jgi:hypothetical protein
MDIDSMTIGDFKKLHSMISRAPESGAHMQVGSSYLIRGVTLYYVGRAVAVTEHEVVLDDASWVADTGRFNEALRTGVLDEVEPFPSGEAVVNRGAIMDYSLWPHALPREVK